MPIDDRQELISVGRIGWRMMQQSFDVAANSRERSSELVRHIGDEIGANGLQSLNFGDVMKYEDGATWPFRTVSQAHGVNSKPSSVFNRYPFGVGIFRKVELRQLSYNCTHRRAARYFDKRAVPNLFLGNTEHCKRVVGVRLYEK